MEPTTQIINPLLEKIEDIGKTSVKLLKLQFMDKSAEISSFILARLVVAVVFSFFALALNTGIALWLGELLGKNYYGFLTVASFYAVLGIILMIALRSIKSRINDSIVKKMFN